MKSFDTHSGVLLALSCAVLAAPLKADITYSYEGQPFQYYVSPLTPSSVITASFTFSSPLPVNQDLQNLRPLFWTVSDGEATLSSDLYDFLDLDIGTDSSGNVFDWSFLAVCISPPWCADSVRIFSFNLAGYPNLEEQVVAPDGTILGASSSHFGSFTTSVSTPEPSSRELLLLGVLIPAAIILRWRFRPRSHHASRA